jgi:AcrR family transcriptional regulator
MRKIKAKDAILSTAARLFYKQGYSNTGINQIIDEAGVAKSTLYQLFRSKEDLLVAYLEGIGETTMESLKQASQKGVTPQEKVIAIFDYIKELVAMPEFYGCHFLNIIYEMPEGEERARLAIKKQKDSVRALFSTILKPLNKESLADEFYTLLEGGLIGHKVHKDVWPILTARSIAQKLL